MTTCNYISQKAKLFKHEDFFFLKISVGIKYPDTWILFVLIMALSHLSKQAEVERSFNNNNLVLKGNLKIDSIVARLFINSCMIQKEF